MKKSTHRTFWNRDSFFCDFKMSISFNTRSNNKLVFNLLGCLLILSSETEQKSKLKSKRYMTTTDLDLEENLNKKNSIINIEIDFEIKIFRL